LSHAHNTPDFSEFPCPIGKEKAALSGDSLVENYLSLSVDVAQRKEP
jgi:hypothetical protein